MMITSKLIRKLFSTNLSSNLKNVDMLKHTFNRNANCLGVLNLKYTNLLVDKCNTAEMYSVTTCCPILIGPNRFYTNIDRKNMNLKFEKSKKILTDNIEVKRQRIRERKEVIVKGIREKKTKVQEKVRDLEELVERENILTIPNLLCVARSFLSPYIGYVIIQEDYQLAIGLLVFAGITDLVKSSNLLKDRLNIFILNFCIYSTVRRIHCTQLEIAS